MGPQFRKFRIELLALLSLSQLLTVVGLHSAQAQTPAQPALAVQSQPATSSQSSATSDAQRPLPDVATLIHQVQTQQRASWKIFRQYTYRMSSSVQELDSHGAAKKTTIKELETICVDVGCFQKLMTIDGKPLADNAMKRQNEYIDSVVAWRRDWKEKTAAGQPPPPPLKIKVPEDMEDENSISTFVGSFLQWGPQLGTFSNIRQVEFHGRQTIAMDYVGNPHVKSPNLIFGVFRNLAGTVWVDEQDHALVRIEGRVIEDYKVGGGLLADVHKGATLQMEWTKVNNEVWLPTMFNGRGSARIMVFVSHSEQIDQRWSDYRKFRTSSTILPGVAEVPGAPQAAEPTQPQP
jgi:hypothetical protein